MVQEVVRIHLTQELTSLAVVVHNGGGLGRGRTQEEWDADMIARRLRPAADNPFWYNPTISCSGAKEQTETLSTLGKGSARGTEAAKRNT